MHQTIVFLTLGAALVLFMWGRLRYDLVALLALLFLTAWGIIPAENAFAGFAHPAVITVAAVLVMSKALQNSGVIVVVGRLLYRAHSNKTLQIAALCLVTALASGFMSNVGALAMLMPVGISLARQGKYPPSHILMPVAFASILGGMMLLIGTAPNIIIATYRAEVGGEAFRMFAFFPVGGSLTLAGILFVALLGWRFMPTRTPNPAEEDLYEIDNYVTELLVTEHSKIINTNTEEINALTNADVEIIGHVRDRQHEQHMPPAQRVQANDVLIVKSTAAELNTFLILTKTVFRGALKFARNDKGERRGTELEVTEVIIEDRSPLIAHTASQVSMHDLFEVNLLAIARPHKQLTDRLHRIAFKRGDVLMLQGERAKLQHAIEIWKCLPLANRKVTLGRPRQMIVALSIFFLTVLTVISNLLPVEVAFMAGALLMVLFRQLPLSDLYTSIDWPVIVLLGAMIPVGYAFETSGGADLVSAKLLALGTNYPPWLLIALLMLVCTLLSNVINNAATALLMAPIALHLAESLQASSAPFLMAVAVASSCAFLTPIGHQSNTLVMRPAGYRFSDYWKLGVPVTVLMLVLGIPLILFFWPL